MLSSRLEYFCLLVVLSLFTWAAFAPELRHLSTHRYFWLAFAIHLSLCSLFDSLVIYLRWWSFSPHKISGVIIVNVPVEEFILFALIFLLCVCAWEWSVDELA
jgi:lycopene cyclase domain-containing protein